MGPVEGRRPETNLNDLLGGIVWPPDQCESERRNTMLNLSLRCEPDDKLWRSAVVDIDEPGIFDSTQCIGGISWVG